MLGSIASIIVRSPSVIMPLGYIMCDDLCSDRRIQSLFMRLYIEHPDLHSVTPVGLVFINEEVSEIIF